MSRKIPFTKPTCWGNEEKFVLEALRSTPLAGGGVFNKSCEKELASILGSSALLTTSGSHALELSALLLDLKPGDEVVVPSFTFVSSANAFILRGAAPVFVDNDRYGNIDLDDFERVITPKTRAVCIVHYAGNSCDMERLVSLCKAKKIALVEDAAQSLGSTYKDKSLGTFGEFGCISFHDTKNVTSGEGGAIIVRDHAALERAEIIREKGTNRSKFLQGMIDKYTWVDVGSSYVLSELNAAHLFPQLQNLKAINSRRGELWKRYRSELASHFEKIGVELLEIPAYNKSNYHTFGCVFKNIAARTRFIAFMRERGVATPFHYVALHTSPYGSKFLRGGQKLSNCMKMSDGLARLPLFYNLTDDDQAYVIEQVKAFNS